MHFPVRPRFPDRSGCRGRDLTTRVRSARRIQRCHVSRCHDPGPWQAALARSRIRRPTTHPVHCSNDNGSEKVAGNRDQPCRRATSENDGVGGKRLFYCLRRKILSELAGVSFSGRATHRRCDVYLKRPTASSDLRPPKKRPTFSRLYGDLANTGATMAQRKNERHKGSNRLTSVVSFLENLERMFRVIPTSHLDTSSRWILIRRR